MKRKVFALLFLIIMSGLAACAFAPDIAADIPKSYVEVDGMALVDFLKKNISENSTVDEIIDVFAEMCETPIEEDLLLLEYGVFDFGEGELFYFDLVRQYPDGEGEYYQLRVSLTYAPDDENAKLNDILWSDDTTEDFFEYMRRSSGYKYAKDHKFKAIDIRIDQT